MRDAPAKSIDALVFDGGQLQRWRRGGFSSGGPGENVRDPDFCFGGVAGPFEIGLFFSDCGLKRISAEVAGADQGGDFGN